MKTKLYNIYYKNAQKFKKQLGIKNFEVFKKKNKRLINKFIYKKEYTVENIIEIMKELGMRKGSIIFIHSSMTEFYNFKGDAKKLIVAIIKAIGEEGTLMMPAYPVDLKYDDEVDFDVNNSISGAGYLSEVFRKYPGVKRSINLQHSVVAYGKLAEEMTEEHHLSLTAWDKFSPYYKMCQYDSTLIFSFGLPDMIGTIIHCVESILKDEYKYFNQFFKKKIQYTYRNSKGEIGNHLFYTYDFARKTNKSLIVNKYFESDKIKMKKISNLYIKSVNAKYTYNRLIELAHQGITIFTIPSPKSFKDVNGKFLKQ